MIKSVMKRYDAYKDSGVEWLGEVPEHWELKRLKELTTIQNSNVDKKSHENELSVKLCNYVDVYKNEFIDSSLDFMQATADESEIKRFTIKKSDVLITKDSETCDDIAVPALATQTFEGVVCGYHLAQFRTKEKMLLGSYLFRLFQSKSYGFRFVISAKGITRVGLGQSAIADSLTPVPPLSEQKAIANYLDTKTAHIDRKIDLLTRKAIQYGKLKQSLINETITRGLDKTVAMKDSGVEWLGDVPEHWGVKRLKDITLVKRGASPRPIDDPIYFDEEGEFSWVRIADLSASERYLLCTKEKLSALGASLSVKRYSGDFILSIAGTVGKPIITKIKCCIHDGFVWFPNLKVNPEFLYYCFSTGLPYQGLGKLGAQLNLNTETVGLISLPIPSDEEINNIICYLDTKTAHLDNIVTTINTQIDKLKELRKTLINDVVTGKIKVA